MTKTARIFAWLIIVAGGSTVAFFAFRLLDEVNSVILLTLGGLGALINAAAFQVLRKFDDAPTHGLTARSASRIERRIDRRRTSFRWKWMAAIFASLVAATAGGLLRVSALSDDAALLLLIGYPSLAIALTLGVLIAVEYAALSKLARELPKRLQAEKKKTELLRGLRGDVIATGPPSLTENHS